ncbi:aminoglycoside phosphotransferase family protein [Metaclostridioides mangenotii]|uniref:aminoglycoside phosphotransferase family protein n=1 Tax=Metaclostridioides mangenotii TaxID=1540 RepID=UPI001F20CD1C|nr:aminoglycoside phosphotransferase family protein [Clostridioides mangenotii]
MKIEDIKEYINSFEFKKSLNINSNDFIDLSILGQGEYNINYLFTNPDSNQKLVIRLNTASQMHLEDQISYEFEALKLLEKCGRTPKPIYLDPRCRRLPYGILVMEFLPGSPLDYRTDLEIAAECLADIHSVEIPKENHLISPEDPLKAVLNECKEMSYKYLNSELGNDEVKEIINRLIKKSEFIVNGKNNMKDKNLNLHIINTELNSGNFLINGKGNNNYIVDWEKPLLGEVEQDLGHFLAPTTTFWKTDIVLSRKEIEEFVNVYIEKVNNRFDTENIWLKLDKYITMTCLRGITWCSMAWIEYQDPNKLIKNEFTYKKIESYLDLQFLMDIEDEYFAD